MSLGTCPALDASVLVLNRFYMAVRVIGARRAFCLLVKNLAEVITLDDGHYRTYDFDAWRLASIDRAARREPDRDVVRAVRFEVEVPRVIRLLGYDRVPGPRIRPSRRNIMARDGHRCQYCGRRPAAGQLSLDHVLPRSRGGPKTWENLVCACQDCNVLKGSRTPREAAMPLLREPVRPRTNPTLAHKLRTRKYRVWRPFLDSAAAFETA